MNSVEFFNSEIQKSDTASKFRDLSKFCSVEIPGQGRRPESRCEELSNHALVDYIEECIYNCDFDSAIKVASGFEGKLDVSDWENIGDIASNREKFKELYPLLRNSIQNPHYILFTYGLDSEFKELDINDIVDEGCLCNEFKLLAKSKCDTETAFKGRVEIIKHLMKLDLALFMNHPEGNHDPEDVIKFIDYCIKRYLLESDCSLHH